MPKINPQTPLQVATFRIHHLLPSQAPDQILKRALTVCYKDAILLASGCNV
jgi:hypothetical protein